jgi:hypothetical protein
LLKIEPREPDFAGWATARAVIEKAAGIGALRLAGFENGWLMKLNPAPVGKIKKSCN